VALYGVLIVRGLHVGQRAERLGRHFSAYLAYGLVLLIAAQAIINIGVNLGLLPTKGLTLPFVSYGGSSMLACAASLGILLRISLENNATYGDLYDEHGAHSQTTYQSLGVSSADVTPGLDDVDQWFDDDAKQQDWHHDKV
jgi:hypothetical protein